jgi:choline dehydrogenase
METTLDGIRAVRRIATSGQLGAFIEREERPGPAVATDDELQDYVRNNAISLSHAAGSCRMGRDKNAVVDPRLRVHGIDNLMIADASIMPTIVSGNTNAAAIMIGEKAADLIRQ